MMKLKIKTGDTVKIIAGEEKGKEKTFSERLFRITR